jgi:hypothetical protein
MARPSLKKPVTRLEASKAAASKVGAARSSLSGRFLSSSEDVAEFEEAARAYTKKHTKNRGAALKALRDMGMITASGRPTKRYR